MSLPFYIRFPFAVDGDRTTVPQVTDPSGFVSMESGYPFDYQRDQTSDPDAKDVERQKFNQILYNISVALQQIQQDGYPYFIEAADNGAVPFPYQIHAYVRWNDGTSDDVYESIVDANTSLPSDSTKWRRVVPVSPFKTGDVKATYAPTLEAGWVWENGTTIGNASSNATGRANADTQDLFTMFWGMPQALPIYTSAGVLSTRGASASADWAANKAIATPSSIERVRVSPGTMGGVSDPGLITNAANGFDPTILGNFGGEGVHILSIGETPAHDHGGATGGHALTVTEIPDHYHFTVVNLSTTSGGGTLPDATHSFVRQATGNAIGTNFNYQLESVNGTNIPTISPTSSPQGSTPGTAHNHTISAVGGGTAHQNVQPTITCNHIIKL